MKRTAFAFLLSLGLHATLLVAAVGLASGRALVPAVRVDVVPFTLQDVAELPLGRRPKAHKPRARRDETLTPKPAPSLDAAVPAPLAPRAEERDGTAKPEAQQPAEAPRRGDVSAYGPEGSTLVAILRLDRLRAGQDAQAYAAALDGLLRLLPDRRLLDETTVDLYRDFDAVLVATPNPLDDTATFLAARHRLRDDGLRAALEAGAMAGGFTVRWRKERGRWVGVRRSHGGTVAERDDRLLLLPAPGLVVIAAPAYAKLLLDDPSLAGKGDVGSSGSDAARHRDRTWGELVARIDAEDGAVPEDAAFALTATSLLRPGVVGARARIEIDGRVAAPSAPGMPNGISILMGAPPRPFLEIRAEFEDESHARSWEAQWPAWRQSLLANPVVLLSRTDQLLSSAELRREERTLVLRATTTSEDLLRLLRIAGSLAASGGEARTPGVGSAPTTALPHSSHDR